MVRAEATAKYVRTSSQKAGLVLDLIRGKNVNHALSALQFSRKSVARDVAKVLRSAVANAQQQEAFGGDVARLFVSRCHANNGPSQKRVRPAPMGRAFRIVKVFYEPATLSARLRSAGFAARIGRTARYFIYGDARAIG